jgi:geranylgeranyl diphosphate synthase type II
MLIARSGIITHPPRSINIDVVSSSSLMGKYGMGMSDDRAAHSQTKSMEQGEIATWRAMFETHLHRHVDGMGLTPSLQEAVAYAVLGGGKRLRPLLTMASSVAVGSTADAAMAPAVAIELIHAFSLVHDDLPAMDDDAMRRNRPTLHIAAGEAMAILAGDAMVPLSFLAVTQSDFSAATVHAMTATLGDATTLMIQGQVLDTLGGPTGDSDDASRVRKIHAAKTGAVIEAACRLGGLAGSATPSQLVALAEFGEAFGLMFQATDDLLDAVGDPDIVGKATGKDEALGKMTMTTVHGIERVKELVTQWHDEAVAALDPLGEDAQELRNLARIMASRSA